MSKVSFNPQLSFDLNKDFDVETGNVSISGDLVENMNDGVEFNDVECYIKFDELCNAVSNASTAGSSNALKVYANKNVNKLVKLRRTKATDKWELCALTAPETTAQNNNEPNSYAKASDLQVTVPDMWLIDDSESIKSLSTADLANTIKRSSAGSITVDKYYLIESELIAQLQPIITANFKDLRFLPHTAATGSLDSITCYVDATTKERVINLTNVSLTFKSFSSLVNSINNADDTPVNKTKNVKLVVNESGKITRLDSISGSYTYKFNLYRVTVGGKFYYAFNKSTDTTVNSLTPKTDGTSFTFLRYIPEDISGLSGNNPSDTNTDNADYQFITAQVIVSGNNVVKASKVDIVSYNNNVNDSITHTGITDMSASAAKRKTSHKVASVVFDKFISVNGSTAVKAKLNPIAL